MFQQAKQIGVAASRIFPISYPFLFRNLDRSLGGAGSPSLEQKEGKAIQCQSKIAPDLILGPVERRLLIQKSGVRGIDS